MIDVSPPDTNAACLCLSASSEAVWCVLSNGGVYIRAQIRPNTCPQGCYWQHVNLEQLGLSVRCFNAVYVILCVTFSALEYACLWLLSC